MLNKESTPKNFFDIEGYLEANINRVHLLPEKSPKRFARLVDPVDPDKMIWHPTKTRLAYVPLPQLLDAINMMLYGVLPLLHPLYEKSLEMYGPSHGLLFLPQMKDYDKEKIDAGLASLASVIDSVLSKKRTGEEPNTKKIKV